MAQAKDVVCGMTVDTEAAAATAEYRGGIYYFCAPGCKTAFEQDPEKYLKEGQEGHEGHHGHGGHQGHCCG